MAEVHDGAAGSEVEKHDSAAPTPATAVVRADRIPNPGFPPERLRVTDLDPKKEKQAERTVSGLFLLSIVGSIIAVVALHVAAALKHHFLLKDDVLRRMLPFARLGGKANSE